MTEDNSLPGGIEGGWLSKAVAVIWEKAIIGESNFSPEKSCHQLAKDYIDSGKTREQCARNFIKWQSSKAGLSGFALGLPGTTAMAITIPADLASAAYIQLRMIAVIGILFGWDPKSDQLRTIAFSCLLGSIVGETTRDVGVKASTRWGQRMVKNIPGKSLKEINRVLRIPNLLIKGTNLKNSSTKVILKTTQKSGTKGIINLTKMVPLLGGIVGGGLNIFFTQKIGLHALRALKEGPQDGVCDQKTVMVL